GAGRLEPRPAREHPRRPDGQEARRLPRAPEAAAPAGGDGGPGSGRPRPGRGRDQEAEEATRAGDALTVAAELGEDAERRLADRELVELRIDAAELAGAALVAALDLDLAHREGLPL